MNHAPVVVGVVMGSSSDWETLRAATEILAEFGVPTKRASSRPTACPTTCSPTPRQPPDAG